MIPHFHIQSFLQHAYGYYSHFRFGLAIIAASLRRFSHPTLRCFLFASKVALTSSSDLRKTEGFYACDDILRLSLNSKFSLAFSKHRLLHRLYLQQMIALRLQPPRAMSSVSF